VKILSNLQLIIKIVIKVIALHLGGWAAWVVPMMVVMVVQRFVVDCKEHSSVIGMAHLQDLRLRRHSHRSKDLLNGILLPQLPVPILALEHVALVTVGGTNFTKRRFKIASMASFFTLFIELILCAAKGMYAIVLVIVHLDLLVDSICIFSYRTVLNGFIIIILRSL